MGNGLALLAAFAGTASDPGPAAVPAPTEEAPRRYHGRYFTSFEYSNFEGCWLTTSDQASRTLLRRHPELEDTRALLSGKTMVFELTFEGTRRDAPPGDYIHGFGHMGTYRCEITLVRLIDSRRLPDAE